MAAVTSRYARAFAEVVLERRLDPDQAVQELRTLVELFQASPELRTVWQNPSIPGEQKRRLLDALAARAGISQPVRNLLAVLIDHRRSALLPELLPQLQRELDQRLGIAEVHISSARELPDKERQALEDRLRRLTGKKVRAHYSRDEKLLGGAVVKLGSTIYDGSVLGQLQKLREQLSAG